MQWLIDIVVEKCRARLGYFDRGDPIYSDFTLTNLITDWAWHDLDLSGIIPSGVRQVKLEVIVNAATSGHRIQFRENGNTNIYNRQAVDAQFANRTHESLCEVTPDSNGIIEYRVTSGYAGVLGITVCGWWL